MKPMGMTALFQIVKPSRQEDAIWDAAEQCYESGADLARCLSEFRQAWAHYATQEAKRAREEV